jgi:hypothetical protein
MPSNDKISPIMRSRRPPVQTSKRSIPVHSTNHMLGRQDVDEGGADGSSRSRATFRTLLRLPQGGQQVALVVLGALERRALPGNTEPLQLIP